MEKYIHLLLICWIISQVGHAVLSIFYEQSPAVFLVPIIRLLLVLLIIGAWRRHRCRCHRHSGQFYLVSRALWRVQHSGARLRYFGDRRRDPLSTILFFVTA